MPNSVKWTGKNLAEIKKLHKDVAHYPVEKGKVEGEVPSEEVYRDWSQHPDNLHIEADGRTLIVALGDTITKDENGRITVEQTAKERPQSGGRLGPGQVYNVSAGPDAAQQLARQLERENEALRRKVQKLEGGK